MVVVELNRGASLGRVCLGGERLSGGACRSCSKPGTHPACARALASMPTPLSSCGPGFLFALQQHLTQPSSPRHQPIRPRDHSKAFDRLRRLSCCLSFFVAARNHARSADITHCHNLRTNLTILTAYYCARLTIKTIKSLAPPVTAI